MEQVFFIKIGFWGKRIILLFSTKMYFVRSYNFMLTDEENSCFTCCCFNL